MGYENNAKGIYLDDDIFVNNLDPIQNKIDFIVAYAGTGSKYGEKFPMHVQAAHELNVPIIAYFYSNPALYLDMGLDEDKWPAIDLDPQIKTLDRMLYSGQVERLVHAIMIDASIRVTSSGQKLTDGWIVRIAEHLMDMCSKRYNKPVFAYISPNTVDAYPNSQNFAVWMKNLPCISTWKSAYENDPQPKQLDWNNFPIPSADQKPNVMYAPAWCFWRYANTKFTAPGISGSSVPLFLYAGDKNRLYERLGFKPATGGQTEVPVTEVPATEAPTTEDKFITMEEKVHLLWNAHPELHSKK